jgi:hypothetical protein
MPDRVRPLGDSLTLAVTSPPITPPVPPWLGLPGLRALIAPGAQGKRRHRAPLHRRFRTCEARPSRS